MKKIFILFLLMVSTLVMAQSKGTIDKGMVVGADEPKKTCKSIAAEVKEICQRQGKKVAFISKCKTAHSAMGYWNISRKYKCK